MRRFLKIKVEYMKEIEFLESWLSYVEYVLCDVFNAFANEPKLVLTESDLKCRIYSGLISMNPFVKYAVHSETTHYHLNDDKSDEPKKVYHFRDLSLLCPWLLKDNEEIWRYNEQTRSREYALNKGFKHKGPAVHIELKMVRQSTDENKKPKVSESDLDNLRYYLKRKHEKRFVVVWGARPHSLSVKELESIFLKAFNGKDNKGTTIPNANKPLVTAYLFDNTKLKRGRWTGKIFEFADITPNQTT